MRVRDAQWPGGPRARTGRAWADNIGNIFGPGRAEKIFNYLLYKM
jgi:hypothetical protein